VCDSPFREFFTTHIDPFHRHLLIENENHYQLVRHSKGAVKHQADLGFEGLFWKKSNCLGGEKDLTIL
jgi:hypothetical protein